MADGMVVNPKALIDEIKTVANGVLLILHSVCQTEVILLCPIISRTDALYESIRKSSDRNHQKASDPRIWTKPHDLGFESAIFLIKTY